VTAGKALLTFIWHLCPVVWTGGATESPGKVGFVHLHRVRRLEMSASLPDILRKVAGYQSA
jgi:hypothetical protein